MCSNSSVSSSFPCNAGVPQGSFLGPLLFSAYVAPLAKIISSFDVSHHSFADDLFVYCLTNFGLSKVDLLIPPKLKAVVEAVCDWYTDNGMLLNASKSVGMVFCHKNNSRSPSRCRVAGTSIPISKNAVALGVTIDSNLSGSDFVTRKMQSCNYHLCALLHLRSILGYSNSSKSNRFNQVRLL